VLNSPSNPTGMVMDRAELEGIAGGGCGASAPGGGWSAMRSTKFLLAPPRSITSFARRWQPDLPTRVFVVNGLCQGWR